MRTHHGLLVSALLSCSLAVSAQTSQSPAPAAPVTASTAALAEGLKSFAVEFRTGPTWQADKAPNEQAHFRAHSANLKRLRDAGQLLVGMRVAERGFIVLAAKDEAAARAEIEADPAVTAGTFSYTLNPILVFYGGTLAPTPRPR